MNKFSQKTLILVLVILALVIAGGALAYLKLKPQTDQNTNQSVNQNLNQNQNVNQNTNSNTTPTTTEEIDTSSWKTYRNEEYGFEFKYPNTLNLCIVDKSNRVVISDTVEEGCVVVYNEKLSSFKIVITPAVLDVEDDWIRWAEAGKGTIGKIIENGIINLGGQQVYRSILEGTGFPDQYSSVQTFTTYVVPSPSNNKLVEVSLLNPKETNGNNIVILNNIVNSIIWK